MISQVMSVFHHKSSFLSRNIRICDFISSFPDFADSMGQMELESYIKSKIGMLVTFANEPQQNWLSNRSLKRNFSELTLQCE